MPSMLLKGATEALRIMFELDCISGTGENATYHLDFRGPDNIARLLGSQLLTPEGYGYTSVLVESK